MAITNGYADLATVKARLDITDTDDDTALEDLIEAASRMVDGWTGRRFYTATETHTITAEYPDIVYLSTDLISITSLTTDDTGDRTYGTTWSADDYDLDPVDGPPYTELAITPNGANTFPTHRRGVRIAGSWGYGTTPEPVVEATILQAVRLWKRNDAPFGVTGSQEHGQMQTITSVDPDIRQLLAPYRRFGAVDV